MLDDDELVTLAQMLWKLSAGPAATAGGRVTRIQSAKSLDGCDAREGMCG